MDQETSKQNLKLDDVTFVLFRHKWMILACFIVGLAGAGAVWKVMGAKYTSEARLLVRYIVESAAVLPPGSDETVRQLDSRGDSIMRTEMEILSSADLIRDVAQAVGPEKILGQADVPDPISDAQGAILARLKAVSDANVIQLAFTHSDPGLCQPVLAETIRSYLKFHTRIHQPPANSETLAEEASEQNRRLQETENKLLELRAEMGGVSLEDAKSAVASEIAMLRKAILEAESTLAAREAMSGVAPNLPTRQVTDGESASENEGGANAREPASASDYVTYAALNGRLHDLRQREQDYLSRFTTENPLVKSLESQIFELEERVQELAARNPELALSAVPVAAASGLPAPAQGLESAASLRARMIVLKRQLEEARSESLHLSELERTFAEIELSREIQQSNLRHMATTLEQSRYDSALQSANHSSIKILQEPSSPVRDKKRTKKIAAVFFAGCFGGGLALAFLLELFLDPRVKRASHLEAKTKLPIYVSIPSHHELTRSMSAMIGETSAVGVDLLNNEDARHASKDPSSSYYEALRDRLIVYFERVNLRRKPKLVGVSACHAKAGVSSVARGLSVALSETGGGNVLLVDLNRGANGMQTFQNGQSMAALPELLNYDPESPKLGSRDALVHASFGTTEGGHSSIRSREFDSLIPKLKASDFDFIVFDMPPLTSTSASFRVAGFLDKMLLVAESERTHMESMNKAILLLQESNAKIALVMNKTREYLPRWLRPPQ